MQLASGIFPVTRREAPSRRRLVAVSVLGVVMVLLVALALLASPDKVEVALLGLIGLGVAAPLLWRAVYRQFDLFEPLTAFLAAWFVLFWLRPVLMLALGFFRFYTYDIRSGFTPMLLMVGLGEVGFLIGYFASPGRRLAARLPAIPDRPEMDKLIKWCLGLGALSFLLFGLFLIQTGGLHMLRSLLGGRQTGQPEAYLSSTAYFYDGIFLAFPAGLVVVAYGIRARRTLVAGLGAVMMAVPLIEVGPTGVRSWLLPLFGSPFVLYYLWRQKRPSGRLLTGLVVVGIVAASFIGIARNAYYRQQLSGTAGIATFFLQHPVIVPALFILGPDTEMASLLSLEGQTVPSKIPYQHGAATGEVLVHPIPRLLWHQKPRPGDEILTQAYFGNSRLRLVPRQYSPLADFYLDFGYPSVLLGMLLLGILARLHWDWFRLHLGSTAALVFFAATLPFWIVLLRGSIADTAGRLLFVIPPILIALYFARERHPSPVAVAAVGPRQTVSDGIS